MRNWPKRGPLLAFVLQSTCLVDFFFQPRARVSKRRLDSGLEVDQLPLTVAIQFDNGHLFGPVTLMHAYK